MYTYTLYIYKSSILFLNIVYKLNYTMYNVHCTLLYMFYYSYYSKSSQTCIVLVVYY